MTVSRAALACLGMAAWALAAAAGARVESDWERSACCASQPAAAEGTGEGRIFRRLGRRGDSLSADYGFVNFNRDALSVQFSLTRDAFEAYERRFGYRDGELAALRAAHQQAREQAYRQAVKARRSQAQLNAALASLQADYDRRVREYLRSRDFKLLGADGVAVDIPAVVRRNAPLLRSLSSAFDGVAAQRRYDSETLVGAVLSLAQTALDYRVPPAREGDRHTGGLLPPASALLRGWGDCDSKTALVASLLGNFPHMRMVGVAIPGHYLMGYLRIPTRGEAYVEHDGLHYVLLEPAGPAWLPPGHVDEGTLAKMETSSGFEIEPFF